MLKKLSLWDLFVTFGLGLFALGIILIHLLILQIIDISFIKEILSSTTVFIIVITPFIFLFGLIIDALANIFIGFIINVSKKLKIKKLNIFEKPDDIQKMFELVKKTEIPENLRDKINAFHWCKDYLMQFEINSPFMIFLSKFGFYRGTSFLFLINGLVILYYGIVNWFSLTDLIAASLSIFISYLLLLRSKVFFQHTGRTAFRHFFIHRHYKKEKK